MEQLKVVLPALVLVVLLLSSLLVFSVLTLFGKRPPNIEKRNHTTFFHFFIDFFVWMIKPAERLIRSLPVTPNQITISSLFVCAIAGLCIATSHLATAGWLYILAGALDVLDGRIARWKGIESPAGAYLDSISDRWCELFVLSGFIWLFRDTNWLPCVILAIVGSLMTSYIRAKGESLNIVLNGGIMQRPERMTVVSIGCLTTAFFNSAEITVEYGSLVLGICLLIVGLGSCYTAVGRWRRGFVILAERENLPPLTTAEDELSVTSQS